MFIAGIYFVNTSHNIRPGDNLCSGLFVCYGLVLCSGQFTLLRFLKSDPYELDFLLF